MEGKGKRKEKGNLGAMHDKETRVQMQLKTHSDAGEFGKCDRDNMTQPI
jgi:hypothetical protein